jgi:CheY-like chemotaxis protein
MPRTLLLADDSVTIQRVIELTFANEDVRVVSVGDGRRALQWMESEWPDIVLVDVEVPDVDGYAVAEHIKTSPRLKNVPVLLLAGAFEPVDEARARRIGCDGVLIKPFEPQHLVTRVKDLLDQAAVARMSHATASSARDGHTDVRSHDIAVGAPVPFPVPVPARTTVDIASVPNAAELPPANARSGAGVPEPVEPSARPVWESASASAPSVSTSVRPASAESAPAKVSLVNAFAALLAAEQSVQPLPAGPVAAPLSDATIEDAVRRVLTRMTDDLVRRLVVESAERLIREEIEKIKGNPE